MFATFFCETELRNWETVNQADKARFGKYFQAMLAHGIYLAPSQFEAGFLSIAHTSEVIEETIAAAKLAMQGLA